jgi:hypothetical protein
LRHVSDRLPRWPLITLTTVLVFAPGSLRAINLSPTTQDVERALKVGRGAEADRAAFHAPYIHDVLGTTVRQIEIVTEFRRYVLKTEERARFGDWMFSQGTRAAQEAIRPWRGRVTIIVQLQFDPLNTYVQVPGFSLVVGGTPDVEPLQAHITPASAPLFQAKAGQTTYLTGATLDSEYEAAALAQVERPVSIFLDGRELARVVVAFGRLE